MTTSLFLFKTTDRPTDEGEVRTREPDPDEGRTDHGGWGREGCMQGAPVEMLRDALSLSTEKRRLFSKALGAAVGISKD